MGFLKTILRGLDGGPSRLPPPPHGQNANLCLYVIGLEDEQFHGIVKIGVTNNIKKRLATLQTGCPFRLEVKAMVYRPDSFQFESWLHEHFGAYRMRQDGEWFDFGADSDPVEIIQRA